MSRITSARRRPRSTLCCGTTAPWTSSRSPPEAYIAGQLRAIVGVELLIDRLEAKSKLSQNRSEADIAGVIDGLSADGEQGVSAAMRGMDAAG